MLQYDNLSFSLAELKPNLKNVLAGLETFTLCRIKECAQSPALGCQCILLGPTRGQRPRLLNLSAIADEGAKVGHQRQERLELVE